MLPGSILIIDLFLLSAVGFFVYGPQVLTGLAGAEAVSKASAAAVTGLTGTSFGYLGAAVAGISIGYIAHNFDWNIAFIFLATCSFLGTICFALNWNNKGKSGSAANIKKKQLINRQYYLNVQANS